MVAKVINLGDYHMWWSAPVSTTRAVTDTSKSVTDSDRSKTDRSLPKSAPDLRRRPAVTDSDRYLRDNGLTRAQRLQYPETRLSVTAVTETASDLHKRRADSPAHRSLRQLTNPAAAVRAAHPEEAS